MVRGNKSLCPNMFDTGGMFGEVFNSDPNHKCGPCYDFQQADRSVGCAASDKTNDDKYNYGFRDQKSTQQNGPLDLRNVTGGTIAMSRTLPGIDRMGTSIGNKRNPKIFNDRECFGNDRSKPVFTTSPVSIQGGMSSMLQPMNKYPPMHGNRSKMCRGGAKTAKDIITEPLKELKDGVVYSMTFGKVKEGFAGCGCGFKKPMTLTGQIVGCIILIVVIWLCLSMLISAMLFGKAAMCPGGTFTPAEISGISTISVIPADSFGPGGKTFGGHVSRGISGFAQTVKEVMVSPFVSMGKLLGGKTSKYKGGYYSSKTTGLSTYVLPKDDCLL